MSSISKAIMEDLFNGLSPALTFQEREFKIKAVDKIKNNYCPYCKKRFNSVTGEECMRLNYEKNKLNKIRCKKFKRIKDAYPTGC